MTPGSRATATSHRTRRSSTCTGSLGCATGWREADVTATVPAFFSASLPALMILVGLDGRSAQSARREALRHAEDGRDYPKAGLTASRTSGYEQQRAQVAHVPHGTEASDGRIREYPSAAVLRAENLERARRFYTDVMGYAVDDKYTGPGMVYLAAGEGTMLLVYERPGMPAPANTNLGTACPPRTSTAVSSTAAARASRWRTTTCPRWASRP